METLLLYSSRSPKERRDSIRKLTPTLDKQRELSMVGRKGYFRKKLVKNDMGKWITEYIYEPSDVYRIYVHELLVSEEKIEQRKLKSEIHELSSNVQ